MAEQMWNDFARLNAGERFRRQSAEMGADATKTLVEAAQIVTGMRVLDVACGAGEPAISLAELLRERGEVTGVDMAAGPLEVARQRAAQRGLTNLHFQQADVHALGFHGESFDRVTSRLGIMFFGNPVQALGELRRVLRSGGRVALLAWGGITQPYFQMTIGTILGLRPELEVPPAARQMLQYGEPGRLAAHLTAAGFHDVHEQLHNIRWDWHGTPEEFWDYFRSITMPFRPLIEKVADDLAVNEAVLAAIRPAYDGEYVRIQAEMVIATAERS